MRRHQRPEQTAVVRHAQVKQFVCNDEILEVVRFIEKIGGERSRRSDLSHNHAPVHKQLPILKEALGNYRTK